MEKYKLTYFNLRGLGEPIRLLFHYVGEKFEDEQMAFDTFSIYKLTTKYGHLPELHLEDGKKLYDSYAIAFYLGKKYGLSGKNEWEEAQIHEIANFHKDVALETKNYIQSFLPVFPEKAVLRDQYKAESLKALGTNFPLYEKLLQESGSGYLMASGITWIDFFVVEMLLTLTNLLPEALEKHPKLVEYLYRVHTHSKLKNYVENRAKTSI